MAVRSWNVAVVDLWPLKLVRVMDTILIFFIVTVFLIMLYAFCGVDLARYSANDLPLLVMVRDIIFIPCLLRS